MLTGFVKFLQKIIVALEPQAANDFDNILAFLATVSERLKFTV